MPDESGYTEEHTGQVKPEAETRAPDEERERAIVAEAIKRFALVCDIEDEQRRREEEDLEFADGQQWEEDQLRRREGGDDDTTGRRIAPRPALTINLVEQPIQQVVGEGREAKLGLTVKPKGRRSNTKASDYFRGVIRAIQTDSNANAARLWSLERATACGRGAYLIQTGFADDGDFDLDLTIERILDQATVYWDPYATRMDRADADWCLVGDWMSEEERLRRWPDKPVIPPDGAFERADHPWFASDDSGGRKVRVMTYYRVRYERSTLAYHPTLGPMPLETMPAEMRAAVDAHAPDTRVRTVERRVVEQFLLDGTQILEEHPWPGRYIPVIPVVGIERVLRGKRRWKGMTRGIMDVQRAFNVTISSAIEAAGKVPRAEYLMYAGQDAGFEEMWDDAPVKNYNRLYVNPTTLDGKVMPLPQRQDLEPAIQGLLLLTRMMQDQANTVVGRLDPALWQQNPYNRPGEETIQALTRQFARASSIYLDNLASVSMAHEGRVLVDLIPRVYDRAGRVLLVAGEEQEDETAIMLKVPFIRDEDGNPVPVPCPQCSGTGVHRGLTLNPLDFLRRPPMCEVCGGSKQATKATMPREYQGKTVEYVDFADGGEFRVAATLTRAYQTQQEEALAAMSQLAQAAPPLVPVYADQWVAAMGFPGSQEIAARLRRNNPYIEKQDGPQLPPEVAQQVQALQLQVQQLAAALEAAQRTIDSDTVKSEAQKEIAALKAQAAETLERLKLTAQQVAQAQDRDAALGEHMAEASLETLRARLETIHQENQQRHEVLLALLKQQGVLDLAAREATVAAVAQARDRQATREDAGLGQMPPAGLLPPGVP